MLVTWSAEEGSELAVLRHSPLQEATCPAIANPPGISGDATGEVAAQYGMSRIAALARDLREAKES